MKIKQPVILVGGGPQGEGHLKVWLRVGAQVIAVVDINDKRAKELSDRFHIASSFTSVEAALEKAPRPVIVDIVTPPETHPSLILTSLEAGGAVLVEKPMTLTIADSSEIANKAKQVGLPVCVMHNWLFEPAMRRTIQRIKEGAIGRVQHVHVQLLSTPQEAMIHDPRHWVHKLPGGRLEETLPHVCYLLSGLLGQDLEVLQVTPANLVGFSWVRFDSLAGIIQGRRATGSFYVSFAGSREAVTVDIIGEKGILRVYLIENLLEQAYISPPVTRIGRMMPVLYQSGTRFLTLLSHSAKVATRTWVPGHLYIMREFVNATQGRGQLPVTIQEAEATVRLTSAIVGRLSFVSSSTS